MCFLGDDDGILPSILEVVHIMKEKSIDYLISLPTYYNWPDFYDPSVFNLTSSISYMKGTVRRTEYFSPVSQADRHRSPAPPADKPKEKYLSFLRKKYRFPKPSFGSRAGCAREAVRRRKRDKFR